MKGCVCDVWQQYVNTMYAKLNEGLCLWCMTTVHLNTMYAKLNEGLCLWCMTTVRQHHVCQTKWRAVFVMYDNSTPQHHVCQTKWRAVFVMYYMTTVRWWKQLQQSTINIQYHYFSSLFLQLQQSTINIQYHYFSSLFRSECKSILYSMTMYVYCDYPAISKGPKQLPNCLKIAETSVVLDIFKDVSAYTVTVFFCCSTWIRYQKTYILVSDRI